MTTEELGILFGLEFRSFALDHDVVPLPLQGSVIN